MRFKYYLIIRFLVVSLFIGSSLFAQESAEELAKKLANPISSLISVPFQNNTDYGIGPNKGSRNTMNIQPVIPISLNKNLNLIVRWVQPWITQNNLPHIGDKVNGLSDAVVSTFLSPANAKNGITWGAGPVFLVPVATHDKLATKQFGIGPTVIALKQKNGWTFGGLVNQIWGMGSNKPGYGTVNQMLIQPFFAHNWKSGAGVGANMEWTENWTSNTTVIWFNPNISGLTSFGKQKVSLAIGPRFNLAAPDNAKADFGWRAAVTFLFPK